MAFVALVSEEAWPLYEAAFGEQNDTAASQTDRSVKGTQSW